MTWPLRLPCAFSRLKLGWLDSWKLLVAKNRSYAVWRCGSEPLYASLFCRAAGRNPEALPEQQPQGHPQLRSQRRRKGSSTSVVIDIVISSKAEVAVRA